MVTLARSYIGMGTAGQGTTAAVTYALPTGIAAGDFLYLVVEAPTPKTITNQNGGTWNLVGSYSVTGTSITLWESKYNGTQGNVTVGADANHQCGRIVAYAGAAGDGYSAIDGYVIGGENTSDTTWSIDGITTTHELSRVLTFVVRSDDSSAAHFSNWTNSSLLGITERLDGGTTNGDGGGYGMCDGYKAVAGATNNTTVTNATATTKAWIVLALSPRVISGTMVNATRFGGSASCEYVGLPSAASGVTFGGWFQFETDSCAFSWGASGDSYATLSVYRDAGQVTLYDSRSGYYGGSTFAVATNTWIYLVCKWTNATTVSLGYITTPGGAITWAGTDVAITAVAFDGCHIGLNTFSYLTGSAEYFTIYPSALSDAAIIANSATPNPAAGAYVALKMELGDAVTDSSGNGRNFTLDGTPTTATSGVLFPATSTEYTATVSETVTITESVAEQYTSIIPHDGYFADGYETVTMSASVASSFAAAQGISESITVTDSIGVVGGVETVASSIRATASGQHLTESTAFAVRNSLLMCWFWIDPADNLTSQPLVVATVAINGTTQYALLADSGTGAGAVGLTLLGQGIGTNATHFTYVTGGQWYCMALRCSSTGIIDAFVGRYRNGRNSVTLVKSAAIGTAVGAVNGTIRLIGDPISNRWNNCAVGRAKLFTGTSFTDAEVLAEANSDVPVKTARSYWSLNGAGSLTDSVGGYTMTAAGTNSSLTMQDLVTVRGATSVYIDCIGDSITEDTRWTYVSALDALRPADIFANYGVSGIMIGTYPTTDAASTEIVNGAITNLDDTTKPRIAMVLLGANNILQGWTGSATYNALVPFVAALKASGFFVGISTITAIDDWNLMQQIDAANALIRADNAGADFLWDVAADSRFATQAAAQNYTYYQTDGLHPTRTGGDIIAGIADAALDIALAGSMEFAAGVAETWTWNDATSQAAALALGVGESVTVSDSAILSASGKPGVSESWTWSDSTASNFSAKPNLSETVNIFESRSASFAATQALAETVTLGELLAPVYAVGIGLAESISLSDGYTSDFRNNVLLSDSITLGENIGADQQGQGAFSADIAESITLTEAVTISFAASQVLSESISMSDVGIGGRQISIPLNESWTVTEGVVVNLSSLPALSESLVYFESLATRLSSILSTAETVTVSESITAPQGTSQVANVSESWSWSESLAGGNLLTVSVADSIVWNETLTSAAALTLAIGESFSVTDVMSILQAGGKPLAIRSLPIRDSSASLQVRSYIHNLRQRDNIQYFKK